MRVRDLTSAIPRHRFPVEPWRLVETEVDQADLGLTESLFSIGNGYIGMRANPSEGREAHAHGTFLNGFHETWPIHHPEMAYAFAKTGQTMVNVPDAKLTKLYVDDEPLLVREADLEHYERVLDFRTGRSHRELVWTTPAGKCLRVRAERMVSLEHRHLAVLTFEVEMISGSAPVVISSQLLNRQDGEDEYHVASAALGEGIDPRRRRVLDERVLTPQLQSHTDPDDPGGGEVVLGYRCANSGMTLACAYRHEIESSGDVQAETSVGADLAKTVFTFDLAEGQSFRLTKLVSYHSSRGIPAQELGDRCHRTISRAQRIGVPELQRQQTAWLDGFWHRTDVEVDGDDAAQQAIRWNLFQIAQATARGHERGVPAKGVTGDGYDGQYFWDTEVYLLPCLAYTNPDAARKLLRFRWRMLPAARARANELSQDGALYPWRTINGEEASAYYAAGTAQYHINAAVAYALESYLNATADTDLLADEGAEILVETARMWADLGFYDRKSTGQFRIHGVTGPDEYTTVVNDNLYTNVMARFNLRYACWTYDFLAEWDPPRHEALRRRTGVTAEEVERWRQAADDMYVPYDDELGIHPQSEDFLEREPWDFEGTPPERYPLLLHYHPLVIYRFQVLKQADVVLAMFLRGQHFSREQKRRNFEYYDPITTGDSSLSACVQSIVAADVGHHELAWTYFEQAVYLDLADSHGNTADGVHIANTGGVWQALVHGFTGMTDDGRCLRFAPRLPDAWRGMRFRLQRHGHSIRVEVDPDGCTVEVEHGTAVPVVDDDGKVVDLVPGEALRIAGHASG